MQIKFKSLVLCSAILSCGIMNNVSEAAGWNNNNNFGQNFNNNTAPAPLPLINNNFNNIMQWNRNNNLNNNQLNFYNNFVMQNGNFNLMNSNCMVMQNNNNFNINGQWGGNNWNNNQLNFYNNFVMQNGNFNINLNNNQIYMENFYKNPTLMKNYLLTRISSVNSNGMKLNEQSISSFDWKLFLFNIANSKSAKINVQLGLKSLLGDTFAYGLGNIFDFNFGKLKVKFIENGINTNFQELVYMFANYYIVSLANGYDISTIQNNLSTLSWQYSNNLPALLQNYGFNLYYNNYYLQRLIYQMNEVANGAEFYLPNKTLDKVDINDWNKAINTIKEIDLAGCIKKLILGVNTGELLFIKEFSNRNSTKEINPILLTNGSCQCWFNSSLQLVNSAVECASKEVMTKLSSNLGYVLVAFLKHLQEKSAKWFNNNGITTDILWNSGNSSYNGLLLVNELALFEDELPDVVRNAWNALPTVKEGKKLLKHVNTKAISSNASVACAILEKIFPEINELYFNNWETAHNNIRNNNFAKDNFIEGTVNTDYDLFVAMPDSLNSYFITNDICQNTSLEEQITKNQYRIGYDKNGDFAVYTVKGMQLCYKGQNAGHFYAHVALDNKSKSWHFADSTGHNSNPNYKMGIFGATDKQFNPYNSKVQTFMYRKMTGNEVMQYVNQ